MPVPASDIHHGRFYVKGWPRLVIHVFGDEITYLDTWGPGRCMRGTFAKWADRIMTADDGAKFADDVKRIKELQAKLADGAKTSGIRLVAENDPAEIATKYARADNDRRRDHAARALRTLAVNLLRVIAGAGAPDRLPRDLRDASVAWAEFAKSNQLAATPGVDELTINHLFADREPEPQTEDQWEWWARTDPQHDYVRQREWAMRELRRSVLREIAAVIDGSQVQISRRESDVQTALDQLQRARDEYFKEQRRQPKADAVMANQRRPGKADRTISHVRVTQPKSDPTRQVKAEEEIAKLREGKRDRLIANLEAHQWTALRAVRSGDPADFEYNDAFTFEVLGSMKLLKRKPSGKTKRDWELTDLGVLALSRDPGAK
jgi:hypothetical protein